MLAGMHSLSRSGHVAVMFGGHCEKRVKGVLLMFVSPSPQPSVRSGELDYWPRPAEQESNGGIRATGGATEPHGATGRSRASTPPPAC